MFRLDTKLLARLLLSFMALPSAACKEREPDDWQPPPPPLPPLTELGPVAGFSQTAAEVAPTNNLLTEARAQLGKRLFYDKNLSSDQSIACASCHKQEYGFADPRPLSLGVGDQEGKRNASQLANLAWISAGLFWDGRAATLEEQASMPISDPLEMALPLPDAIARLSGDPSYISAFEDAYGGLPSIDFLEKALASFIRTLVSTNSSYDRYLAGEESALTKSAQRGLAIFVDSRGGCFHCHSERTLTNDGFFNNGTYVDGGDVGRQALTGRTGDLGKFRVPNLRNIAVTAPYMHDGSLETLEDVVEHYSQGGLGHISTDVQIETLDLSEADKADLVSFLESLTDESFLTDTRFQPR